MTVLQQPDGRTYAPVLVSGNTAKYDLVFLGEGFTAAEQEVYNTKVQEALAALAAMPPYAGKMECFNVWRINVASAESGIDDLANNVRVDTAFGVRLGVSAFGEARRLLYSEDPAAIYEAAAYAPDFDNIVVLVNHPGPAGAAFGDFTLVSIAGGFAQVVTHELGHNIGGLGDEYPCYRCDGSDNGRAYIGAEPEKPNLTINLSRSDGKWSDLIDPSTPIPTVFDEPPGVVGLWEGGGYYASGIYRPRNNCHMGSDTIHPFCPVCERHLESALADFCRTLFVPHLPAFELVEILPSRVAGIRWPIPVCLTCPPFHTAASSLTLFAVEGAIQSFRLIDAHGRPIEAAVDMASRSQIVFTMQVEAGRSLFLEYADRAVPLAFRAAFRLGATEVPL